MVDLDMYHINEPELPLGRARGAIDENLRHRDEAAKQLLARIVENLLAWTEKLNN